MTDADRPGDIERYAVDCALYAAWGTEFWVPGDPDYGFMEYFEAAVTRNLGLLWGFETLAEDMDRRGIVPPAEGEQAMLVTDGGEDTALPIDEVPTPTLDSWESRLGNWATWAHIEDGTGYKVHAEYVDLEVPPDVVTYGFELRLDYLPERGTSETLVRETIHNPFLALRMADELAGNVEKYIDDWEEGLCPRPEEVDA